jgi:hypothetical protein
LTASPISIQPFTDGVENQLIAEIAALQVPLDRVNGRENALEALAIERLKLAPPPQVLILRHLV